MKGNSLLYVYQTFAAGSESQWKKPKLIHGKEKKNPEKRQNMPG